MSGHLIIFAIDVVAIFGSLLLAAAHLVRFPRDRTALLVTALFLCNVCYVVLARHDYAYWIPEPYRIDAGAWEPLLNIGRNLAPGLFMLLCHFLFQDRKPFPRGLLVLFAVQVLLEEPIHLVLGNEVPAQRLITEALPGLLESMFACLAVYWTIAGWRSDLVQLRRRLRGVVLTVVGLLMLGGALLLRIAIPWDSIGNYYAHVVISGLWTAMLVVVLLSLLGTDNIERFLHPASTPLHRPPPRRSPEADATAAEVARLEALMNEDRVYRQAGLSVSSLAKQMGMPEYRLRRLIHEELGHRNFNAFLHEYRIREACGMLRDPELSRTPILTIALSVGYQSINTFNRGFREVMGVTPSAYRVGATDAGVIGALEDSLPES